MSADQKFARWVKVSIAVFVVIFGYFLFADAVIPMTPQAKVTRVVTQVAPQVSGTIVQVDINNNQRVKPGQRLFTIDPRPYRLAVENAQLSLQQAHQQNAQLDAKIAAAAASLTAEKTAAAEYQREAQRVEGLFNDGSASQQQLDQIRSQTDAAQARVAAAKANLNELRTDRGALDDDSNLRIQKARTALDIAQLNLAYTEVRAKQVGQVSNLQLQQGAYARAGQPLLAVVGDEVDLIADFREKSLRNVNVGQHAYVVFDAQPGEVYQATVSSIDAGVAAGQLAANGVLADPLQSNRWVRDAQRLRIHLRLAQPEVTSDMPAGAKATVQLLPESGALTALARMQIRAVGLLHYIY